MKKATEYLKDLPKAFTLKQAKGIIGINYLAVLAVLIQSGYIKPDETHSNFTKL